MKFLISTYTDVGARKKVNQDSMLVMQADTKRGPALLAAVCDGMGGLAKGEVASAAMVNALRDWFTNRLPVLLSQGLEPENLKTDWFELVGRTSQKIADYAASSHAEMGTTVVVLLAVGDSCYSLNVGDSRIYLLTDNIYQMTKDQTYVQREIDQGRMTPEQAEVDPKKNVLLQCVGASRVVEPDFGCTGLLPNQVYLLCSDGFRHVIQPQEIYQNMNPGALRDQDSMRKVSKELTDLNMARGEVDNISSILIKTFA